MAELIKWGSIAFYVTPTAVRGVKEITIEAGCETEDSEVDGEKIVKRKSGKPYVITMTAILDARLGEDVQSVAFQLTEAARCSNTGYFYTGRTKLFPSQFMMVTAKISEIALLPSGKWLSCEVALTLKQCTKYDGTTTSASVSTSGSSGSSGGGGSSGGSSSSKVSTKTTSYSTEKLIENSLKAINAVQIGTSTAKQQSAKVDAAAASATTKKTTTSSKVSTVKGVKKTTSISVN